MDVTGSLRMGWRPKILLRDATDQVFLGAAYGRGGFGQPGGDVALVVEDFREASGMRSGF